MPTLRHRWTSRKRSDSCSRRSVVCGREARRAMVGGSGRRYLQVLVMSDGTQATWTRAPAE